jgi:hypothetical protein
VNRAPDRERSCQQQPVVRRRFALVARERKAARDCQLPRQRLRDRRDPTRIDHELTVLLKTRIFAIACGYKDAMIWTTCVTIRF